MTSVLQRDVSVITAIDFSMQLFGLFLYLRKEKECIDDNISIISVLLSGLFAAVHKVFVLSTYRWFVYDYDYMMAITTFITLSLYGGLIILTLERFFAIYLHLHFETSWFKFNHKKILTGSWLIAVVWPVLDLVLVLAGLSKSLRETIYLLPIATGNLLINITFIAVYSYIYRAFRKANVHCQNFFKRQKERYSLHSLRC